jgi:toxin secretion/phage lysis holin
MHNTQFQVLLLLIIVDYLSGVLVALYEQKLRSSIGRKGILKKFGIIMCVAFCVLVDSLQIPGIPELESLIILFFSVNESVSILENLSKIGVPLPRFLKIQFEEKKNILEESVDKVISL